VTASDSLLFRLLRLVAGFHHTACLKLATVTLALPYAHTKPRRRRGVPQPSPGRDTMSRVDPEKPPAPSVCTARSAPFSSPPSSSPPPARSQPRFSSPKGLRVGGEVHATDSLSARLASRHRAARGGGAWLVAVGARMHRLPSPRGKRGGVIGESVSTRLAARVPCGEVEVGRCALREETARSCGCEDASSPLYARGARGIIEESASTRLAARVPCGDLDAV
jgi:hypothetical protein